MSSGRIERWRHWLVVMALSIGHPGVSVAHTELVGAGPPLSEMNAVDMSFRRPAFTAVVGGSVAMARAEALAARLWPNPVLSYVREQVNGGPGASDEDFVWLSQTFDLSGRRGLRAAAATQRVAVARQQAEFQRLKTRRQIRLRFFEVLLERRQLAAIEQWSERMARVAQTVARREAAGDVSGYDRKRLEREEGTALAQHYAAHAAYARTRERLAALLAVEGDAAAQWSDVTGELLPDTPPPPLEVLVAGIGGRPDLQALAAEQDAAVLDERAAERWWMPKFALGAGVKSVEIDGERSTGFLLSTAIPLPLIDRDQDERLRAAARARLARGERQLRLAEALGEVRGYWTQAVQLSRAARELLGKARSNSVELVRTAEAAYGGGELDIVGLLDAYRSAFQAEVDALNLEMDARRARIELDYLTGGTSG